jgi:adenine-specific DNA-methyltransferase
LQARYREQVKCVYIDPNYNTEKDDFLYKDGYKHSTWVTMMVLRLHAAKKLLADHAFVYCSIDEHETARLRELGEIVFRSECFISELIWNTQHSQQSGLFTPYHEYVQVFGNHPPQEYDNFTGGSGEIVAGAMKKVSRANPASEFEFPSGTPWDAPDGMELTGKWGDTETVELVRGRMKCENGKLKYNVVLRAGWTQKKQMERFFKGERPVLDSKGQEVIGFFFNRTGKLKIIKKRSRVTPKTLLPEFGTTSQATGALVDILGRELFGRPKPVAMIQYLVSLLIPDGSDDIILDYFAGSGTTAHAVINLNREDGGKRKYILVEMADYFDTVLKPHVQKVIYSADWKDGKPVPSQNSASSASPRETSSAYNGISHCFKYIRLESYEDTLNNLDLRRTEQQADLFNAQGEGAKSFKEDYIIHYMLDVESRGSASLLNTEAFMDPTAYKLKVKIPGSDESRVVPVDLMETFNYLLGLQVEHIAAPQRLSADFERDSEQRLCIKGRLKELSTASSASPRETSSSWWFRTVTGTTLDGRKILVIWRNRPGGESPEGVEQDNLVLDEWFKKMGYSSKDREFDLIYVNGTNNLENLKTPDDQWKVRLIEEDFKRLMFEETGV